MVLLLTARLRPLFFLRFPPPPAAAASIPAVSPSGAPSAPDAPGGTEIKEPKTAFIPSLFIRDERVQGM